MAQKAATRQLVIIHSRGGDGFRRGGIAHRAGRDEHPIELFTEEQLAAIQAEPLLSVEIVDAPEPAPAPEPEKGKGKGAQ